MLTKEIIKADFAYVKAWTGDSEVYHGSEVYEGHGRLCDIYFKCKNKEIKQEQVETYNQFKKSYRDFLNEINHFINHSISLSDPNKAEEIKKALLLYDVIEVPFENYKYDLVLICGKEYKKYLLGKKNIGFRVEFKDGRIKSIEQKQDTMEDNNM